MIRLLARSPLLHFLLVGALAFVATRVTRDELTRDPRPIVVTAEWAARAVRAHVSATGRRPDAEELEAQIQAEIEEEILYRRALELGLDRDDRVVQRRLIRDVDFLAGDTAGAGDETAAAADKLARARALGIDRSDVVVRRRLIQRFRQGIESAARREPAGKDELRAYYDAHAERYAIRERVTIETRFFEVADEPARVRAERALATGPADVPGDPPPLAASGTFSERELAKLYGGEWAAAVAPLPIGRWSGPLEHPAGAFLVLVEERIPERTAPLDEVRSAVADAVAEEAGRRAVADAVTALRPHYIVVRDDRT